MRKEREMPDTKGETETFLTRNVRLITFLICIAVFLGVFGPLSVFQLARYFDEQERDTTMGTVEMTVEDLRALLKRSSTLTEADFKHFLREDGGDWTVGLKTGRMFYIQIGERFQLACMVEVQTKQVVYLSLWDDESGTTHDLLDSKVDIDAVLK